MERGQLQGPRNVEAVVERAGIRCANPEEGDRAPPLALPRWGRPGAGDDPDPAGDDPVGAEHADTEIGDVHRAALALAVAGLPAIQLGHHAVEVGALGDAMAVAPMRRDDPVALTERGADANRDRLLADVAVH